MCFFHWHHSFVMVCLVMLGLGVFLYLALRIAFHGLPGNNISWSWHCRTCQKHSFKYHIWKPIAPVFALSQFIYLWGFHFVTCMVMSVLIFFFFCFYFHWAHLMACLAMLVPGIYLLFFIEDSTSRPARWCSSWNASVSFTEVPLHGQPSDVSWWVVVVVEFLSLRITFHVDDLVMCSSWNSSVAFIEGFNSWPAWWC